MAVRMLYLMFVRLTSWMVLLARSSASKDAELLRGLLLRPGQLLRQLLAEDVQRGLGWLCALMQSWYLSGPGLP